MQQKNYPAALLFNSEQIFSGKIQNLSDELWNFKTGNVQMLMIIYVFVHWEFTVIVAWKDGRFLRTPKRHFFSTSTMKDIVAVRD